SIIAKLGITDVRSQLYLLAGLTVVIFALESFFQYAYQVLWRNLAQTIQHDMRVDTYGHVQNLELSYFEDQSTGSLMSILNNDINQLERFLDGGASTILQLITSLIIIMGIFFYTAPSVAWMAAIPIPLIIWGSIKFQRTLAPKYANVREMVSQLNAQLSNNLGGIATIKSFTSETYETERIANLSDQYRSANREAIRFSSAFVPFIRMVIVGGFSAIMIFGGFLVFEGQLNVGVYSLLVFITQRLLWPLTSLGETLDMYQRSMASIDRILNLLAIKEVILDGENHLPPSSIKGEITFDQVSFEYKSRDTANQQNEMPVIRDLSIQIPAGQTIGIVGATGAGKSTLVKLLLRFYDVNQGRISLDGHDLRSLVIDDLRGAIGFVSQDVFLFHGTVRENITYGTFDATIDQITQAAKIAEAHEFIMELPNGYDTIVGERGQKLSGGQRQRISIARAVVKNPPVLILDEATSSVDNETEAAIQRSMDRISVGRTTIIIAHRLSTIRNADTIFVLEKGLLKENGTHEELLSKEGLYAGLWKVQTGAIHQTN
ncbi:MAG: ABC transporter ATP-binding protein, partial [Anaerolineales bacterium]